MRALIDVKTDSGYRAYEECVERRQILSDVTMQPQIHIGELLVRLYHLLSLVDYRDGRYTLVRAR